MVSYAICELINSKDSLGLTLGANLFAEEGSGDKYIVISAPTNKNILKPNPSNVLRRSNINIFAIGYDAAEGYNLSEKIHNYLESLYEVELVNSFGNYVIKSCATLLLPQKVDDKFNYMTSYLVFYQYEQI